MTQLVSPDVPQDRSKLLPPMMPLAEVINMRMRFGNSNNLFPECMFPDSHLEAIADDPAMQKLTNYSFSPYSLEPTSLGYLKEIFSSYRPTVVIELGSGISTALLSLHLRNLHGPDVHTRYVTIDQSSVYAEQTKSLLNRAGAQDLVQMIVTDTASVDVCGRNTECYDLNADKLSEALGGKKADLLIIDGPAGGMSNGVVGSRLATVPLLRPFAAHEALFFLDDGFRDSELEIASIWSGLDYVQLMGIKAVGKGMLVGCFVDPEMH